MLAARWAVPLRSGLYSQIHSAPKQGSLAAHRGVKMEPRLGEMMKKDVRVQNV